MSEKFVHIKELLALETSKKVKELSNEIVDSRAKKEGSGEGDTVRQ